MSYTVLIVDDNPDLLDLYERAFPVLAEDIHVIVAADGLRGLTAFYAANPRPACVVIDVKMPELDGNQLVRAMRGDPDTADTPLIILTAMPPESYRLAGLVAGADVFLTKPVMPQDLIVAIQQVVAVSREQRRQNYQTLVNETLADTAGG